MLNNLNHEPLKQIARAKHEALSDSSFCYLESNTPYRLADIETIVHGYENDRDHPKFVSCVYGLLFVDFEVENTS